MHRLTSSLPAYACHVTLTWSRDTHSTMEESCFATEVNEKKTTFYYSNTLFNWQEDIQQTRLLT